MLNIVTGFLGCQTLFRIDRFKQQLIGVVTIVVLMAAIWRSYSRMPHTFNWESVKVISIGVTFQGPGTSFQNELGWKT